MKIKAWKGGRSERIYARMTKEAKAKLLARVKAEGYKSLGDWLEAQAETQLTPRALDGATVCAECGFPPSHHDPSCYARRKSPRQ